MSKSFGFGRSAAIVIGLSVACTAGSLMFIQSQHEDATQHPYQFHHWDSLSPDVVAAFDAVRDGRSADLDHMLKKDPTLVNADGAGFSLFDLAALRGNIEIAQVLIKYHADPDAPDRSGATPLDYAALVGSKAMVQWLITHNANVNARSRGDLTPIFFAARGSGRFDDPTSDYIGVCELLLKSGASPNLTNQMERTPVEVASEPVARFLLDHGAKMPQEIPAAPSDSDSASGS
ncbi:MAG TPA: ankyrin repeat domain-containing protein [Tepidisphaeraceae bacterium]|jgi:hypothetical protein